ncbi:MAG: leucine-rich repeat domain-containing protein [Mangrovibacterium sp.]
METIFSKRTKQFIAYFVLSCFVLLTACKKDDDGPNLSLGQTSVEVAEGDVATVSITSGSGTYSVTSTSAAIATAAIEGSSVKITAISEGSTELTVLDDGTGKTETINVVVVENLTLDSASDISAKEDEVLNINILSGSGDYSVTVSDETVATASISENILTINTLVEGSATITITDNQTSKSIEINLLVAEYIPKIYFTASATWVYQITINAAVEDQPNVWIDLDNDGIKDEGEAVEVFDEVVKYERADEMTIYGKVTELTIAAIKMESIDLTQNKYLQELTLISQAALTSLDLSQNTELTYLDIRGCRASEVDLSKNPKLKYISFSSMPNLVSLDLSNNPELETINGASCTELKTINLGNINKVTKVDVWLNPILSPFSVSNLTELTFLRIHGNAAFTELPDLSNNTKLEILSAGNIEFTSKSIDLSNNPNLIEVHFPKCKLGSADLLKTITNPEKITSLSLHDNLLTSLDVSGFTSLNRLSSQTNQLDASAMKAFIASLPTYTPTVDTPTATLILVDTGRFITPAEQNVWDDDDIAAIKAKNWKPYNQYTGASIISM